MQYVLSAMFNRLMQAFSNVSFRTAVQQYCWQDFNWHNASRGSSAIAELLVWLIWIDTLKGFMNYGRLNLGVRLPQNFHRLSQRNHASDQKTFWRCKNGADLCHHAKFRAAGSSHPARREKFDVFVFCPSCSGTTVVIASSLSIRFNS